jgi:hypothetical protein
MATLSRSDGRKRVDSAAPCDTQAIATKPRSVVVRPDVLVAARGVTVWWQTAVPEDEPQLAAGRRTGGPSRAPAFTRLAR